MHYTASLIMLAWTRREVTVRVVFPHVLVHRRRHSAVLLRARPKHLFCEVSKDLTNNGAKRSSFKDFNLFGGLGRSAKIFISSVS
jgi:hypothetical protein